MDISLQGYNNTSLTFLAADSDLVVGEPVTISGNYEVERAGSGDIIFGFCASVNGDYVSVITHGVVDATYSGSSPGTGHNGLCCAGSGAIKVDVDAVQYYQVLNIDTTNKICTILL